MKRWLFIGYVGSFLIFAAFPIFRLDPSMRVFPGITDHASHWGAALLMSEQGWNVYRHPVGELCAPTTPEEREEQKAWNCHLRSHPDGPPFTVNWPQYPRVYPPGAMLLGAPEALLFKLGWIDFGHANLLFVLSVLVAAHVASLLLFLSLWTEERTWQSVVLFVLLPMIHLQLVQAALGGIYDPVAILGITAGVWLWSRGRLVGALVAISAGEFTHFRALWYLPFLMVVLAQLFTRRAEWWPQRRSIAVVAGAGVMLAVAAVCFLVLLPALHTFRIQNQFNMKAFSQEPPLVLAYGVPLVGIIAVLARNRSWVTLSVAVWQLAMLVQTREVQQWHALFLLPLLAIAAQEKRGAMAAVVAVLLLFLWEFEVIFAGWPLTGELLPALLRT